MINNRIQNTFKNLKKNKKKALITFVTGCDPNYKTSQKILNELVKQGADLLEIGMPFSDPMADGPSIQRSSIRALIQGANIRKILKLVHDFRKKNQITPIILMGYLNPILSFGINNFFKSLYFFQIFTQTKQRFYIYVNRMVYIFFRIMMI